MRVFGRWIDRAALGLLCLAPAHVAANDAVRAEIGELEQIVTGLEANYLAPELLERQYELTARLNEGQLYFFTGDYGRAAIVLLDLVENPRSRTHPAYGDAVYYLAESLFRSGTYQGARTHFDTVLRRGNATQQQQALGRLLEIAVVTNDIVAAQRYLAQAGQQLAANPEPSLLYSVGKYHYRTGDLDAAKATFGRVPEGTDEHVKAQYFIGVTDVRAERLNEALTVFLGVSTKVKGLESASNEILEVGDLAHLARARIYYEQGEFERAIDAYNSVRTRSEHFDEAVYEGVWIAIKQENYERALRNLEILLISQPDVLKGPESRLLRGKLLMLLGRYSDAELAFQEVLFEFGPLQSEMRTLVARHRGDLANYFNRLIGKNIEDFDLNSFLPPRAAEFAGEDVDADRALTLVSELASEKRDILDAKRTIERLEIAVQADNRIEIFPKLHEGWLRSTEVRARLTEARARLIEDAGRGVSDSGYADLQQRRRGWGERFADVPKTAVDLQARDAEVDGALAQIDQRAFELGIELRAVEAQLVAVKKYVEDLALAEGPSGGEGAVRATVDRELQSALALEAELESLIESIEAERIRVGVNDAAFDEDATVRSQYVEAMKAEERWLASNGKAVPQDELSRIDALERRVSSFQQRAARLVDDKVADIQRQLSRERANVEGYDGELLAYRGETESLGGQIAARSFSRVLERIEGVVLEADVGIIDVAWKQKQDGSQQISELLGKQREELDALERDLREVNRE